MKNISSFLKNTLLPLAISSTILLNGCSKKEERKSIRNFLKLKNPGETEYIEYKKIIKFEPEDFKKMKGTEIYHPICYDLDSEKKFSIDEEFFDSKGDNTFLDLFNRWKNKLVTEGYDFSIYPHSYGITNLIFPEYNSRNFLFFGKEYIRFNEKGNFIAEPLLDRIPQTTYQDLKKALKSIEEEKEEYLTFIKTNENNHYILKEKFRRGKPPKMEIEVYKLKNEKIPSYSSYLPVR